MSTTVIQTQTEPLELASLSPTCRRAEDGRKSSEEQPPAEIPCDSVPPPNAQSQTERWNYPKGNVGKLVFAFLSSIIAGMNDGAVGVRLVRETVFCIVPTNSVVQIGLNSVCAFDSF
jgi:hypothetical protein